jgi:hypothetical protein
MRNRLRFYLNSEDGSSEDASPSCNWSKLAIGARIIWTPDGKPIREIAPRSKRPVGKYCSRKAGRLLAHLSRGHGYVGGEKLAIMREEINPETDDLRTHHIRFDLVIDGVPQSFIPALILLRHDGAILVRDVKRDHTRLDPGFTRRRSNLVRDICSEIGWTYEDWGADEIASTERIRLSTVEIQAERFVAYEVVHLLAALALLRTRGGVASLLDLKNVIGGGAEAEARIKAMMCHGHLAFPLDSTVNDSTQVRIFQRCGTPALEYVE